MSQAVVQTIIRVLLVLALSSLFPVQAASSARALVLAHMFDKATFSDRAARRFAQLVEEYTNGRLKVEVYGAGQLGDERNNLLQLKRGDIDFAVTGDLVVSYMVPAYEAVNMPFIYRSPEHAVRVCNGPIGDAIRTSLHDKHGIDELAHYYSGTRLLTANTPIANIRDLKGLRLRLPPDPVWQETWAALGAKPRAIPFTELFRALQRKRVDAQENPPNFIRAMGLQQVQRYLILTNHMPQRQFILANAEVMATMPATQRAAVQRAATETAAWLTQTAKQQQQADIDWLRDEGGMKVLRFNNEGVYDKVRALQRHLPGKGEQLLNDILATY